MAGPIWWISWLIFPIELISNFIRPFSLGIRLFGNLFADEKVVATVSGLAPPYTWIAPLLLMPLSIFVAFIQTFVFILLSQLYLGEVSHAPHEEHVEHEAGEPAEHGKSAPLEALPALIKHKKAHVGMPAVALTHVDVETMTVAL